MNTSKRFVVLLILSAPILNGLSAAGHRPGQALQPQTPRDARAGEPAPVGTASIAGTVTVAGTGQPARRARMNLSGIELRAGRTATTDEFGRFSFTSLPAGRFSLSASKPGHVSVTYGQRVPGRPGTPIQLRDGQKLDVQLQIPRGGVITGLVLDEHGEPVPGTPVRVMRYTIQSGFRTLQQTGGSDTTDDRGVYRIYGLQPGDYLVAATPRNSGPAAAIERVRAELLALRTQAADQREPAQVRRVADRIAVLQAQIPESDEPATGYAPVYYPGTTVPSGAGAVAVGLSEEKSGVDFQLQLVPMATVEGIVVAASGALPPNTQVSLINMEYGAQSAERNSTRADSTGAFRIPNVVPGNYTLVARATIRSAGGGRGQRGGAMVEARRGGGADSMRLWAMTPVSVDGRNLSSIVLTLQPGMTISGRIAFDGASTPPADLSRLRVMATPADVPPPSRELATSVTGQTEAAGRFTITGVVPGRYRITAAGAAAANWALLSSMVSGQDSLDFPIEVKPNENVSGVILTFSDRMGDVTGTIVDGRGQPAPDYTIVVYPAEPEYRGPGSRRIRSQRPGTDGSFTFRNLPPGEYRIAPVLDPEPGTWFDPAFLQQLDATALRVPLGPGEKKVQNLRIGG